MGDHRFSTSTALHSLHNGAVDGCVTKARLVDALDSISRFDRRSRYAITALVCLEPSQHLAGGVGAVRALLRSIRLVERLRSAQQASHSS